MARCYHCGNILDDAWVKREGASLMGKEGGKAKKRDSARAASLARWSKEKQKKYPHLNSPIDK